ncbi:c-type cytochrome [Marinomonas profundimaris]|uniref:c-type cytochrome n=1 Tax=Marinomonas profundimaris TaxID=1208321 RepID=UPI001F1EDD41|nr:cytochrome c5 family protein [Marinomonas profundimaris]
MLNHTKHKINAVFLSITGIYLTNKVEDNSVQLFPIPFSLRTSVLMPFKSVLFVRLVGVVSAVVLFSISSAANAERSGEQTFNTYCIACHMSGVAGAPRFGNHEDWQPRIDKGLDTLLKDAISGFRAMPPKGLCFDCSDDELKHAIEYMIDNSQQ